MHPLPARDIKIHAGIDRAACGDSFANQRAGGGAH